ncbi:MAG: hypothetical protein GY862_07010 [Gammaproteobacteria bacterium]|nr:hypothetical protein [Gammaproteobacteria bacterium]
MSPKDESSSNAFADVGNILQGLNLDTPGAAPAPASRAQPASPPRVAAGATKVNADIAKKMFPDAPQSNINKYLPHVLNALEEVGLGDKNITLMALATIRAETAGFQPVSEYKSKYNSSPGGHPFDLYDNRSSLGNQGPPDGERFKGRGFIQLTGRYNYQKYNEVLGLGNQLVDNPDMANDPVIAARILAAFIKDKESQIKDALQRGDLRKARKLVNGGSHGLDQFKAAYETGNKLLA